MLYNEKTMHTMLQRITGVYIIFVLFLAVMLSVPPWTVARAHQTGLSWENIVGNYKLDIGYDPVQIQAGEPQRFDFDIFQMPQGTNEGSFTDVWVRISEGQNTIFASGIHRMEFGKPGMIITFPKAGNYQLYVRFENSAGSLAEETLPVTVVAGQSEPVASVQKQPGVSKVILPIIIFLVGSGIGAAIISFLKKKRHE